MCITQACAALDPSPSHRASQSIASHPAGVKTVLEGESLTVVQLAAKLKQLLIGASHAQRQ